jgi:hypothetical protein
VGGSRIVRDFWHLEEGTGRHKNSPTWASRPALGRLNSQAIPSVLMNSPTHLSPKQFSQHSGLSIATVHRYLKAGRLPYVQPAGPRGRILIQSDALARLSNSSDPGSAQPHSPTHSSSGVVEVNAVRRSGPVPRWKGQRTT